MLSILALHLQPWLLTFVSSIKQKPRHLQKQVPEPIPTHTALFKERTLFWWLWHVGPTSSLAETSKLMFPSWPQATDLSQDTTTAGASGTGQYFTPCKVLGRLWWMVPSDHTQLNQDPSSLTALSLTFGFIVLKPTSNHTFYRFYRNKTNNNNLVNNKEKCAFLAKILEKKNVRTILLIFFKAEVKYTNQCL